MLRGLVRRSRERRRARRLLAIGCCLPLLLLALAGTGAAAPDRAGIATPPAQAYLLAQAVSSQPPRAGGVTGLRTASAACGETAGLSCLQVAVPLDRTGVTPGTISLHVEVLPAEGIARGAIFLIAGGPGQGSAHVFGLGNPDVASLFRFIFPGYTLVAYDDRGTGSSALIDCPELQRALTADAQRAAAGACADIIGPQRVYYSTADHVEDLDAVRQALNLDKVGLFGVSYGTKLALAYSLAHPSHVDRLVLDSVLPPELSDPYGAEVVRQLPATLGAFCSNGSCRSATSDFAGDAVAVANSLAAKPLEGPVVLATGKTKRERLDGLTFLSILLDADLNPGLAAELPAVLRAARVGNTQPLLRLALLHDASSLSPSDELSSGLYAATVCRDGPFPWTPDTPIVDRPAIFKSAVDALPAGTFGPFGSWAARFGNADFCLDWPSPSGGGTLGAGPLPNVPVLAVSGGFDMRTPTANAVSVVARFPQGKLLVVPGVGHSVVTADPSGCALLAVRGWVLTGAAPATCPRPKAIVPPIPALPVPGPVNPRRAADPLRTYALVSEAVREAEAAWLMAAPASVPGIFGGRMLTGPRGFTLVRYSVSRGVELSGTLRLAKLGLPLAFQGAVTVSGPGASIGIVGLSGSSLRGTLGSHLVGR